jgi:hypothetical protein
MWGRSRDGSHYKRPSQRRWILSATPTRITEADNLRDLYLLLDFLGHDPYGYENCVCMF